MDEEEEDEGGGRVSRGQRRGHKLVFGLENTLLLVDAKTLPEQILSQRNRGGSDDVKVRER